MNLKRLLALAATAIATVSPARADSVLHSSYFPTQPVDRAHYLSGLRWFFDLEDRNKDGVLSPADPRGDELPTYQLGGYFEPAPKAGAFLSWNDVETYAIEFFNHIDKNGDGFIGQNEIDDFKIAQISQELGDEQPPDRPDCPFPTPTPDAEILLLSAYETQSLASVGMHDTQTRAGLITVAQGSRPLYIVLPTYDPVVWMFQGDTARIQKVVLTSLATGPNSADPREGPPLAGAVGLSSRQVQFMPDVECLKYFSEAPSRNSILLSRFFAHRFGRAPDVVSARYRVAGFQVPEGKVIESADASAMDWRTLRTQVNLFYPGGVVPIDPKTVISSQPVQTLEILPGVAGLRQLVQQGALVPLPGHAIYRVTRKIRLPVGLHGAMLAKFIVPQGVPVPEGDPGHSCIMSETGDVLGGICR